jgi:hypothetical protein
MEKHPIRLLTITSSSFCFGGEWLFEWNIKLTGTACFHAGRKTFKKSVCQKQTILLCLPLRF